MDRSTGLVVAVVLCSVVAGLFLVEPAATAPEPVNFDDTVTVGGTYADRFATPDQTIIPKAQVFYTRYRYVVGYYGVGSAASHHDDDRYRRQFGNPQEVYVTDFAGTDVSLSEEGYPLTDRQAGWMSAYDAVYVVDSGAWLPSGPTALPFSDRNEARKFADEYGGTLVDWAEFQDRSTGRDPATAARNRVDGQHAAADQVVADAAKLRNRSVSVVVGEDAPTITDAIERAPTNTTVLIPDGTYEEELTIKKSIPRTDP
jgi:nitrous oxide reductase accessory protein NosL